MNLYYIPHILRYFISVSISHRYLPPLYSVISVLYSYKKLIPIIPGCLYSIVLKNSIDGYMKKKLVGY